LSTELVTSALANFDLGASESARVADVYTAAIGSSALNARRLKLAMSQAGPAGAALGQSLESTTAAVAILTTSLGSGERAGTGFRGMALALIDKAEELGVAAADSAGNFRPLVDIIRDVEAAGIPTTKLLSIMGAEAGPALAILVREGADALETMTERIQSTGQAAKVAGEQLDTLQGDLDILASKQEEFWVLLGQSTTEGSRIITQAQTEFWQALVDTINENSDEIGAAYADMAELIDQAIGIAIRATELIIPAFDLMRASAIVAGEKVEDLSGFIQDLGVVADKALGPLDEIVGSLIRLVNLGEPETLLKLIQTLAPLGGIFGMVAAHAATTGAEVGNLAAEFGEARDAAAAAAEAAAKLDQEYSDLSAIDLGDPESIERINKALAEAAKRAAAEKKEIEDLQRAAESLEKQREEAAAAHKLRVAEELRDSKSRREELEKVIEQLELEVNLRRALIEMGGFQDLTKIAPEFDPFAIPEHEPWVPDDLITEQEEIQREAARVAVEFEFLLARAFDDMSVGDLVNSFATLGAAIGVKMGEGLSEELQAQWANALSGLGAILGNVLADITSDTEASAADWLSAFGSIWGPVGSAIGGLIGGYIDSRSADAVTGQTEFQVGGTQLGINALEGSVKAINEAFARIEELVSGTIESTEKIEIKTRANGEVWLRIGEIMNVQVDSVAEALDLATTWLLKTAEFSGVPEQVLQALAHTSATTIEELTRDLALAMDIARLDMGPVRAFFMDLFDKVSREIERAIELGIDPDPLIKKAGDDLLEALRNATTPEEHQQLAEEISNQRAQLEAALAAAQDELVRVQGLIQRYLEGTTRLPQAVIDNLMRQAQDIAAQIAGIEAQLGLLPTDIPAFSGGGGGGRRGRREQQERTREGLRDQVEGLERGVLDPFQQELLSLGDIIPDLTAELDKGKLSAAEYAALLARATAAVDAMGQALVDDLIDRIDALAPASGALTDSLAAIDDQVATLAAELAMLGEAGLMSADAIAEASAALEANAAAARFAQVEQRAQDVLLQALTFLGREEEVARLRFQIDQAGLLVAIAELELAQEKYGLELAIFDQLGGLAAEIAALEFDPNLLSPPTASPPPSFNRLDSAASDAARALEEMQRRLERANESLRDLVDDLSLGEVGAAVSPQQALAFAESRYRDTLARAQAGDLEAREALSGVARDFLDVLGDYSPELLALESPRILAEIQRLLGLGGAPPSALAPSRVLDGGNRFGGGGPSAGAAATAPVIAGQQPAAGLVDLGIVASAQLHTQRAIKTSIDNLAEQQRRAIDQNARFLAEAHAEYGARAS
jgi:hypothetical protein